MNAPRASSTSRRRSFGFAPEIGAFSAGGNGLGFCDGPGSCVLRGPDVAGIYGRFGTGTIFFGGAALLQAR